MTECITFGKIRGIKNQSIMSNAVWLMDFLLILGLYGTILPPDSAAHHVDYNQDGVIDVHDLMDHLQNKPQVTDFKETNTRS